MILTCAELLALLLLCLYSLQVGSSPGRLDLAAKRELVEALALTDYAIWTEARYTRHPSQADFFAPFQDAPSSFEHFPAGSVVAPPVFSGNDR